MAQAGGAAARLGDVADEDWGIPNSMLCPITSVIMRDPGGRRVVSVAPQSRRQRFFALDPRQVVE